jgi:hypothetical protein
VVPPTAGVGTRRSRRPRHRHAASAFTPRRDADWDPPGAPKHADAASGQCRVAWMPNLANKRHRTHVKNTTLGQRIEFQGHSARPPGPHSRRYEDRFPPRAHGTQDIEMPCRCKLHSGTQYNNRCANLPTAEPPIYGNRLQKESPLCSSPARGEGRQRRQRRPAQGVCAAMRVCGRAPPLDLRAVARHPESRGTPARRSTSFRHGWRRPRRGKAGRRHTGLQREGHSGAMRTHSRMLGCLGSSPYPKFGVSTNPRLPGGASAVADICGTRIYGYWRGGHATKTGLAGPNLFPSGGVGVCQYPRGYWTPGRRGSCPPICLAEFCDRGVAACPEW